jgi:DNA-binding transcriptional ArsR family regulator
MLDQLQEETQDIAGLKGNLEPVDFIEKVTGGLLLTPSEQDVKVILIPQYHAQPTALLCAFEGLTLCHYSSGRLPLHEEGEPTAAMTRKLRALSDRTRLKILHFLKTGPKAYMEIYKHMGMSKSTVHEHMLQLRGAGLVRSHLVGENNAAYSIRDDAIGILNEELVKYLK